MYSLGCVEYLNPTRFSSLAMCSSDGRFRIRLGSQQLETLLATCRDSEPLETGGLLVGRYNETHDTAIVTRVWGPPKDSVRKRASFRRGTYGLQVQLDFLWKTTQEYYLGEWHFHPGGIAQPSKSDIRQMVRVAKTLRYNTPEPILIIVGGSDWEVVTHVFSRDRQPVRLDTPA